MLSLILSEGLWGGFLWGMLGCPPGICSMSQLVLQAEVDTGMDTDAQVLVLGKEWEGGQPQPHLTGCCWTVSPVPCCPLPQLPFLTPLLQPG